MVIAPPFGGSSSFNTFSIFGYCLSSVERMLRITEDFTALLDDMSSPPSNLLNSAMHACIMHFFRSSSSSSSSSLTVGCCCTVDGWRVV